VSVETTPAPPEGAHVRSRGVLPRVRASVAAAVPFIPALLILAIWAGSVTKLGSYYPIDWYLWSLATTLVLAFAVVAGGRALPAPRLARIALAAFGAWVAWNYVSLLWADSPGSAWDAANKLFMYLAGAWTLALIPWRARPALMLLGAWSLVLATVGALNLDSALSASDISPFFIDGRYSEPFGYPNGVAAAAALGMLPALALSARREVPVPLQAVFLGIAAFLVELALLPQSRGALIGMAVGLPVLVILSPDRLRLVPRVAVLGGALAFTAQKILDVSEATTTRSHLVSPVLEEAVRAMGVTVAWAAGIGLVLSLIDRYVRLGERGTRRVTFAMNAGLVLGVLAALAVLAVSASRISDVANEAWGKFRTGTSDDGGDHVLSTGDPQRYDYWSASYHLFLENPVSGIGAGNFGHQYAARREFERHSRYAHNFGFRILAETGIPGAVAFLALIAAIGAGVLLARIRVDPAGRAVIATTVGMLAYFLVHAALDWLDEFPALAAPVLALPFVGLALLRGTASSRPARARASALKWAAISILLMAALVSAALPYLSYRYLARGREAGANDPALAYREFQRARDVNPLSVEPDLARGTLDVRLGRNRDARADFHAALEREPNWYAHFELSLLASHEGRFEDAATALARARRLNVADPMLYEMARRIRHKRRVDPQRFNRLVLRDSLYQPDRLR
jgi:hypothetical protein